MVDAIHVHYTLRGVTTDDEREKVARVLGIHADSCPLARTIRDSVKITTDLSYAD